eukprot:341885-Rhodomonas_salina.2
MLLAGVGVGEEGEETAGKKGEGASTGSSGSSGLTASGSASRDGSRAGTGPGGLARLDAAALAKVHVTIDTALLGTDMPERRFSVAGPVILSNLNPAARAVIAAASAPVSPGPPQPGSASASDVCSDEDMPKSNARSHFFPYCLCEGCGILHLISQRTTEPVLRPG